MIFLRRPRALYNTFSRIIHFSWFKVSDSGYHEISAHGVLKTLRTGISRPDRGKCNRYRSCSSTRNNSGSNHDGARLCQEIVMFGDKHVQKLCQGMLDGKRSALAESITLVESTHPLKRRKARLLLSFLSKLDLESNKIGSSKTSSFRIGLSGPPGAGKSTFIETFGKYLTNRGHKVAVLAVDPSSSTTGGSLLGDKTRMNELSRDPNAYIRPSPASGYLGGVTRTTNESIILCEATGYDIILIETMGVGQSEFKVVDMVDMFCLIIPPVGGDELQGIKRGIVEMSDLIIVNKADGDLVSAARKIQTEYSSALRLLRPRSVHWRPKVKRVSSLTNSGIPELWDEINDFFETMIDCSEHADKRKRQRRMWLWNYIYDEVISRFKSNQLVNSSIADFEQKVYNGEMMPGDAADYLVNEFFNSRS